MSKNLLNKYAWLVETIYNSNGITLGEIQKRWCENDMSMGEPLPRRTFYNWCYAAQEMFGVNIECEVKGGYRYFISNEEELKKGGLRTWLLQTLSVSNLLMNNQTLKDRILLENIPAGQEFLPVILEAMKKNIAVKIKYQSFYHDDDYEATLYPYCVKVFKQRWYVLAECPYATQTKLRIYALDRVHEIQPLPDVKYQLPEEFDAQEFFENVYGIIVMPDKKPEKVRLKVYGSQVNYVRSLPLHKTQKEVEKTEEYSIFELIMCPEFDFQQEILSQSPDIEVLEPAWLRDEIKHKAERLYNKYNK